MLEPILADASALSALFDADADTHEATVEILRARPCRLVAPPSSIARTLDALAFSREAQEDFLSWARAGGVSIEPVSVEELLSPGGTRSKSRADRSAESLELEVIAARTGIKAMLTVGRGPNGAGEIALARVSPALFREKPQ